MSNADLDQPDSYRARDPDDMYRHVEDLPEQIERAWAIAADLQLPESYHQVRAVLVVGMGGSAIGGSLLGAYAETELRIPYAVWRGYGLPGFVDEHTLVIIASYSGQTEETLSGFQTARDRGAKIIAVTTGGTVGDIARRDQIPTVGFDYVAQPRATLGYLFTPLLAIFAKLGLLPPQGDAVAEAIVVAGRVRDAWEAKSPEKDNLAKQIARRCFERTVVVYGGEYLAAVARRWKTQLNENSKNWAFWEEFPELDHNAIVGYERPTAAASKVNVVVLRGGHLGQRVNRRIDVTGALLKQYGVTFQTVIAEGDGKLAEMISLILLGDFVSYYLALLNGVDPTVIAPITRLKEVLAGA